MNAPYLTHNLPKAIRKRYSPQELPEIRRRAFIGNGIINAVGKQEAMALGLIDCHELVQDEAYGKYLAEQYPGARYLKEKPKRESVPIEIPEVVKNILGIDTIIYGHFNHF